MALLHGQGMHVNLISQTGSQAADLFVLTLSREFTKYPTYPQSFIS